MSDVIVVMQRRPDPAAGQADRALRAAGQPVRRRLHRRLEPHHRHGSWSTTRRRGRGVVEIGDGTPPDGGGDGSRRPAAAGEQVDGRRATRAPARRARPAAPIRRGTAGRGSTGRIHQGTYLGDQTEFRITTDVAGEVVVRRQNATRRGGSLGPRPGRSRSSSGGRTRQTWSSSPDDNRTGAARAPHRLDLGGGDMAENLDDILKRAAETQVPRRSFLAAAGLLGGSAALAACSGGSGGAAPRRPRRRAPPASAAARRVGLGIGGPGGRRREASCSCTTGRTTSTPTTWRSSRRSSASRSSSTTCTPTTRSCSRSSRPARRATTSPAPTAEYTPAMVEGGYIQKLDLSPDPEPAVHQPGLQGPVVGPERRVPAAQGLRHDRRPVPQQARDASR